MALPNNQTGVTNGETQYVRASYYLTAAQAVADRLCLFFDDETDSSGYYRYPGSPEGNVAADIGSLCSDTTNGPIYYKTTDTANTGWVQVGASGSGVNSVSGTLNRISIGGTASDPVVDIDSNYVGQASITTLGTVGTGMWEATDVGVAHGGTGRSTATAYAVLCGGTTATGAHQSIASLGTAGQVLTSSGAGALPTFEDINLNINVTTPGAYPYTQLAADDLILVDSSSPRTINLQASPATGKKVIVKDNVGSAGTNNITVNPNAGNIDGDASKTIAINYGSITFVYNGTQWSII